MKRTYEVRDRADKRAIREFLKREGQFLLPMLELVEQTEVAIDEVIQVMGRATIEAVLEMSAEGVAGVKQAGRSRAEDDTVWYGRQGGVVYLLDRKVRVERPRLRRRGAGEGGEVEVPAYAAMRRPGAVADRMLEVLMAGVSTRKYGRVIGEMADTVGVSKSAVSRETVEASERVLKELMEGHHPGYGPFGPTGRPDRPGGRTRPSPPPRVPCPIASGPPHLRRSSRVPPRSSLGPSSGRLRRSRAPCALRARPSAAGTGLLASRTQPSHACPCPSLLRTFSSSWWLRFWVFSAPDPIGSGTLGATTFLFPLQGPSTTAGSASFVGSLSQCGREPAGKGSDDREWADPGRHHPVVGRASVGIHMPTDPLILRAYDRSKMIRQFALSLGTSLPR